MSEWRHGRALSRTERRACAAITLFVFVISSLPYLYGWARQTAEERFTGIVFDVVDTAQYFAWMRAFSHQPLIANPLTPEPGSARFFNLQWWLLGQLAYGTSLGPVATYQLLRVVALAGFAIALAVLCRMLLPRGRVLAFALVLLSSGFGWVLAVVKHIAKEPDLRLPLAVQIGEANTFFSAMAFPHLLVAGALILGIFALFLAAAEAEWPARRRYLALLLVLTPALGFSHGYDLLPVLAIPAATIAARCYQERRFPALLWPGVAICFSAAPPALYVLLLTRLDPTWQGVLSQYGNAGVYTPAPPHLVILLGLPFVLALWQLRPAAWRGATTGATFLRVWLVCGFALLYIPTDYQVKMLTTYQVPVALLATETVLALAGAPAVRSFLHAWSGRRLVRAAPLAGALTLVVFVALTNVYLTAWRVLDLDRADYPYYLSGGDVRTLERLNTVVAPNEVVLSSPELGVFVPVYSDARPFVAHWAQTLDFFQRRRIAAYVYRPGVTERDLQALLRANRIAFVLAGPAEAVLSGTMHLPVLPLEQLAQDTTILYQYSTTIGAWP